MWNNHLLGKAPGGRAQVGQAQIGGHAQASMAAHAAANRAKAMRSLSQATVPVAPPVTASAGASNWKHHVAAVLTSGGIPTHPQEVHQAVGAMTQAGHFTPAQGAGLQAHNGMLHGAQGLATMAKIGGAIAQAKQPAPVGDQQMPT